MFKIISWGVFILVGLSLMRCVPKEEENLMDISLTWRDSLQRHIYDLKDRRQADSLIRYFHHPDATYRYLSVLSFASIQDSSNIDSIISLLRDPVDSVRRAAVIALGQLGSIRAEEPLIGSFRSTDSTGAYDETNRYILEAVGKIGRKKSLINMATVKSYLPSDIKLLEGQAWGIYRFALRGMVDESGTKRMIEFLKSSVYPPSVQWIAAQYLYRASGINLNPFTSNLIRAFKSQKNPEIKMNLAIALGKTRSESARVVLFRDLELDQDYRVRCNVIRALGNYNEEVCGSVVSPLLKSQNEHLANTAADYFYDNGIPDHATDYKEWAQDTSYSAYVRARLFAAAAKHLPFYYVLSFGGIRYRLYKWLLKEKDPYVRSQIIRSMGEDPKNYRVVIDKGLVDEHYAVRTAAASALKKIFESEKFEMVYQGVAGWHRRAILKEIHTALKKGDPGVIAELSPVFEYEKYNFNAKGEDFSYLDSLLKKLPLPQTIETYNILNRVISHLKGVAFRPRKPDFNHPMDWSSFLDLPDTLKVKVKTEKGDMLLRLMGDRAPATVLNFANLAKDHFFDGKSFHRVVTNFVVQDGCSRGDGYGALDYTLRSELEYANYHKAGVVGMASAGKDTECTQWFITHCPVPFLDGRYTVFAQLESGDRTLNALQVGDVIQSVEIME